MSRSGYNENIDDTWSLIRWRGAVASSIRGMRGQAFLIELRDALDALDNKRLIANDLESHGEVCAIGALGKKRGVDMSRIDPDDSETVAGTFNIAHALACEIEFENDEGGGWKETPEHRFTRMRQWVDGLIDKEST